MNPVLFLIPLLLVVSVPTAFAQVVETKGQNYDLVENFFIGEANWKSHPERIMDGSWQNYALSNTGDKVIFMQARLGYEGFKILRLQKFSLPFQKNNQIIKNLPELIDNVYNQFINKKNQRKLYLGIHSDGYHYEMTYVNVKDNKKKFREFLKDVMEKSYGLNQEKSYSTFNYNHDKENSAVICYSKNKEIITRDYEILLDSGIQPRYNTSLPVIMHNLYKYYNILIPTLNIL